MAKYVKKLFIKVKVPGDESTSDKWGLKTPSTSQRSRLTALEAAFSTELTPEMLEEYQRDMYKNPLEFEPPTPKAATATPSTQRNVAAPSRTMSVPPQRVSGWNESENAITDDYYHPKLVRERPQPGADHFISASAPLAPTTGLSSSTADRNCPVGPVLEQLSDAEGIGCLSPSFTAGSIVPLFSESEVNHPENKSYLRDSRHSQTSKVDDKGNETDSLPFGGNQSPESNSCVVENLERKRHQRRKGSRHSGHCLSLPNIDISPVLDTRKTPPRSSSRDESPRCRSVGGMESMEHKSSGSRLLSKRVVEDEDDDVGGEYGSVHDSSRYNGSSAGGCLRPLRNTSGNFRDMSPRVVSPPATAMATEGSAPARVANNDDDDDDNADLLSFETFLMGDADVDELRVVYYQGLSARTGLLPLRAPDFTPAELGVFAGFVTIADEVPKRHNKGDKQQCAQTVGGLRDGEEAGETFRAWMDQCVMEVVMDVAERSSRMGGGPSSGERRSQASVRADDDVDRTSNLQLLLGVFYRHILTIDRTALAWLMCLLSFLGHAYRWGGYSGSTSSNHFTSSVSTSPRQSMQQGRGARQQQQDVEREEEEKIAQLHRTASLSLMEVFGCNNPLYLLWKRVCDRLEIPMLCGTYDTLLGANFEVSGIEPGTPYSWRDIASRPREDISIRFLFNADPLCRQVEMAFIRMIIRIESLGAPVCGLAVDAVEAAGRDDVDGLVVALDSIAASLDIILNEMETMLPLNPDSKPAKEPSLDLDRFFRFVQPFGFGGGGNGALYAFRGGSTFVMAVLQSLVMDEDDSGKRTPKANAASSTERHGIADDLCAADVPMALLPGPKRFLAKLHRLSAVVHTCVSRERARRPDLVRSFDRCLQGVKRWRDRTSVLSQVPSENYSIKAHNSYEVNKQSHSATIGDRADLRQGRERAIEGGSGAWRALVDGSGSVSPASAMPTRAGAEARNWDISETCRNTAVSSCNGVAHHGSPSSSTGLGGGRGGEGGYGERRPTSCPDGVPAGPLPLSGGAGYYHEATGKPLTHQSGTTHRSGGIVEMSGELSSASLADYRSERSYRRNRRNEILAARNSRRSGGSSGSIGLKGSRDGMNGNRGEAEQQENEAGSIHRHHRREGSGSSRIPPSRRRMHRRDEDQRHLFDDDEKGYPGENQQRKVDDFLDPSLSDSSTFMMPSPSTSFLCTPMTVRQPVLPARSRRTRRSKQSSSFGRTAPTTAPMARSTFDADPPMKAALQRGYHQEVPQRDGVMVPLNDSPGGGRGGGSHVSIGSNMQNTSRSSTVASVERTMGRGGGGRMVLTEQSRGMLPGVGTNAMVSKDRASPVHRPVMAVESSSYRGGDNLAPRMTALGKKKSPLPPASKKEGMIKLKKKSLGAGMFSMRSRFGCAGSAHTMSMTFSNSAAVTARRRSKQQGKVLGWLFRKRPQTPPKAVSDSRNRRPKPPQQQPGGLLG
ncbi:hypothetical protein CBR_g9095 [Chara braunii]|uniref:Uncharacterized protein n=1 Tax=Chara braunii TaxID=69332 RepID=A0A388KNR1_CHABU|nr:hypothetical protein CBR_g9095 [Chara braunii]|eukprot:GBG71682.1 hypothetical protein CBR_g9095 [Chara braunii]